MNVLAHYGVIVAFSLFWSSAFIAGKIAIAEFGPFTTLWIRFAVSALLLFPFCAASELKDNTIRATGLLLGVFNNVLYLGLTFSALRFISPGWVVIITACSPFMTGALSALFSIERLSARKLAGMVCGFAGVFVMTGLHGLQSGFGLGLALALLGTLSFAAGTVFFRSRAEGMPLRTLNFRQSVSGAALLLPIGLVMEGIPSGAGLSAWAALLWLVSITIFGNALWLALIRRWGAATASSFHLLNPVSGLALSFVVLGISAGPSDIAGAALIIAGLLVTTREKTQSA